MRAALLVVLLAGCGSTSPTEPVLDPPAPQDVRPWIPQPLEVR